VNATIPKRERPCPSPAPDEPTRPSFDDVVAAQRAVAPYIARTGFYPNPSLSALLECRVFVKYENHQRIGSFKIRGTLARLIELTAFERTRGVVTASQGNHGQGVAYAGSLVSSPVTVVVPSEANPSKVEAMRNLGAEVLHYGSDFEEASAHAWDLSLGRCLTYIQPGNDATIIAGHGTCALEMFEDVPHLEAIFVPVGGGSLASGVALVARTVAPTCEVIGAQSIAVPGYLTSLALGRPVSARALPSIAEGIAVPRPSPLPFSMVSDLVDDVVGVTEGEIRSAMRTYLRATRNLAEGAAAAALAGALRSLDRIRGKTVGLILTGGNLSSTQLEDCFRRQDG